MSAGTGQWRFDFAKWRSHAITISTDIKDLIEHYAGNPLALKMVAAGILDFFEASISDIVELSKS